MTEKLRSYHAAHAMY